MVIFVSKPKKYKSQTWAEWNEQKNISYFYLFKVSSLGTKTWDIKEKG
jgi:hypothetical protein